VGAVEFTTLIPWVLDEPYNPAGERTMDKAEEMMARYRKTLRNLANKQPNVLSLMSWKREDR
jgi:hypothetical protein